MGKSRLRHVRVDITVPDDDEEVFDPAGHVGPPMYHSVQNPRVFAECLLARPTSALPALPHEQSAEQNVLCNVCAAQDREPAPFLLRSAMHSLREALDVTFAK